LKVLYRSIFKELLWSFLLCLFVFNFLLVTEKVVRLARDMASVGLSPWDMLSILIYLQPLFTVLTVPLSLFMSVLIVYGRLNSDNELTVMRTTGMSFSSVTRPAFMVGVLALAISLFASFWAAPAGTKKLREKVSDIIAARATYAIEEGIFNSMFRGIVIYARERGPEDLLHGLFLYDGRNPSRPSVVYARDGMLSSVDDTKISLELGDGHISFLRNTSATDMAFDRYSIQLAMSSMKATRSYQAMTPFELLNEARAMDGKRRLDYLIEFHRRLTFPFLCIVLMALAPPLSLRAGKTGKLSGLAMGFFVIAAYYGILVFLEGEIRMGRLPHYLGAWLPFAIFMSLALFLFRQEGAR
jgi:lipopolysaccharide export system permease protein